MPIHTQWCASAVGRGVDLTPYCVQSRTDKSKHSRHGLPLIPPQMRHRVHGGAAHGHAREQCRDVFRFQQEEL